VVREIKFRAFVERDIIEGWPAQMHPVENICWRNGGLIAVNLLPCEWIETKWVTLCEYTGIKDKNGKEIYEGDLLSFGGSKPVSVVYEQGSFGFEGGFGFVQLYQKQLNDNETWGEVIGNIYENEELLK